MTTHHTAMPAEWHETVNIIQQYRDAANAASQISK